VKAACLVSLGVALVAHPATLKPEALKTWEDYVENASGGIRERANAPSDFLRIDATPAMAAKVHSGQIVVSPAVSHIPRKVPSGLIHHWIGTAFLPSTTIKDVAAIIRDYPRYAEVYAPHVLFVRVGDRRMYSVTQAKRIREIADYGTAKQHTLPEGQGTGLIWRLYSISRFEEREDGLYIETEAMALSRDIPSALRLVVEPIVRRVSREALETALRQTANAAHAAAVPAPCVLLPSYLLFASPGQYGERDPIESPSAECRVAAPSGSTNQLS
jgi:hypothetical protein